MITVLELLPLLGAAALIVLAQLRVKERSETAALALTAGAATVVATFLGYHLLPRDEHRNGSLQRPPPSRPGRLEPRTAHS